jgi:hypothetical protein
MIVDQLSKLALRAKIEIRNSAQRPSTSVMAILCLFEALLGFGSEDRLARQGWRHWFRRCLVFLTANTYELRPASLFSFL